MRPDQQEFTVLIPTRNRPERALELILHLRGTLRWGCRLIVADQSDDGGAALSRLLAGSAASGVEHVADDGRGANRARNLAAARASSEWLLFLDDDVRPAERYLEALADFIQENPWVDVVQGTTRGRAAWERYVRGEPEREMPPMPCEPGRVDWSGIECLTTSPWAGYPRLAIGIGAGNFAVSRRAFVQSGGFDERMAGPGEDREFGLRLWWLGYRCMVSPRAVAFHLHEASGGRREQVRLLTPQPPPSWVYFHMKWFPGRGCREMLLHCLFKTLLPPWRFPVRAIRLWRAFDAGRSLLAAGPVYIGAPQPRTALQAEEIAR